MYENHGNGRVRETKDFRGGLVTYQKKVKEAIQKKIYVRKKEAFIDFNHEESEDDEVGKR